MLHLGLSHRALAPRRGGVSVLQVIYSSGLMTSAEPFGDQFREEDEERGAMGMGHEGEQVLATESKLC